MTARSSLVALLLTLAASTAFGWELLVTTDGRQIEGDVSQAELIFIESDGSEVAIPRAAMLRFERTELGLQAHIKDGTKLTGTLQGKLEIEDGLIRRRYGGDEISLVEFDRFISPETGKTYHSCPIRVEMDASSVLVGDLTTTSSSSTRNVNCHELRILGTTLKRSGRIRPGKPSTVTIEAEFAILVPDGTDQLLDVSTVLVQGDSVVGRARTRFEADAGERAIAKVGLQFSSERVTSGGPPLRLRAQVVSQDSEQEIEKGSFFWWFTIPIPLG